MIIELNAVRQGFRQYSCTTVENGKGKVAETVSEAIDNAVSLNVKGAYRGINKGDYAVLKHYSNSLIDYVKLEKQAEYNHLIPIEFEVSGRKYKIEINDYWGVDYNRNFYVIHTIINLK
jgi:hypothetical protein